MKKLLFLAVLPAIAPALHGAATEKITIKDLLAAGKVPKIDAKSHLNLTDKGITDLEGLLEIPNIATVRFLRLTFNKIKCLPKDGFKGMDELVTLLLDDNDNLKCVNEGAFNGTKNLKVIRISRGWLTKAKKQQIIADLAKTNPTAHIYFED